MNAWLGPYPWGVLTSNAPSLARSLLLALMAVLATAAGAGADEEAGREKAWKSARKEARARWTTPGEAMAKLRAAKAIAADNSGRAADLLMDWWFRSHKWCDKELIPAADEAREKHIRYESMLLKSKCPVPPKDAKQLRAWQDMKKARERAKAHVDTELMVRRTLAKHISDLESPAAADWIVGEGFPMLRKRKNAFAVDLRVAAMRALARQPLERVKNAVLACAGTSGHPHVRAIAFAHLARQRSAEGFPLVLAALKDKDPVVHRSALAALREYDDPACVPAVIAALPRYKQAFVAQEAEALLHWFTGKQFNAVAKVWKRWLDNEGQAWLAAKSTERHPPQKRGAHRTGTRATFYDIPTTSQAIVFVLDRSGSMKEPAGHKARKRAEDKPKGPVTGGGDKNKGKGADDDEDLAGATRLAVAKSKLKKSITHLAKDVRFGLVFYSTDVEVWRAAPELANASPKDKEAALAWFDEVKPEGSTRLFDALMKALEYAAEGDRKRKGGANTIFLLSDGAPTDANGALTSDAIQAKLDIFLKANEVYRCVVHTIGVGPTHNRNLMMRIAKATGGEYRAVGTK